MLAARRPGDALVVTKLDRLARSLRNATDMAEKLASREACLNIDGAVCSPTDPVGWLLFNVLGFVAEFESDLTAARGTTFIPVLYPVPKTAARPCGPSASGAGGCGLPPGSLLRVPLVYRSSAPPTVSGRSESRAPCCRGGRGFG